MKNMKKILFIVIIPAILLYVGLTFVIDYKFWGIANSENVLEAINKNKNDTIIYDSDFLNIGNMPMVYRKTPSVSFFKYYIYKVGVLYRWSEASHKLDSIYSTFEKPDEKYDKKSERQKLGLDK